MRGLSVYRFNGQAYISLRGQTSHLGVIMKLFRRLKYRFRRFIISFISILSIICVTVIPAHSEVFSPSPNGLDTYVSPYYWNGTEWIYSNQFLFQPGKTVDTGLRVPAGNAFGMTFDTHDTEMNNAMNVSVGVLHFRVAFVSNIYFTAPRVPYVSFGKWLDDEYGQIYLEQTTVEFDNISYNSSTTAYDGSGSNRRWLVTTDIYVESKYIPYSEFSQFYFYIQRDTSPDTRSWSILCKEFTCEVLTGADVPKYSQPDTSAKNELDSVEGELNGNIDSFGSDIGSIFNFDAFGDLVHGMAFWNDTLAKFFNNKYVSSILSFSLAVGIFSLLFGLFESLVRSTGHKNNKPKKQRKSKGG